VLSFERKQWERGICRLAGIDEAGRGPLAGPVVAAAVVFDPSFAQSEEKGLLSKLTDSKKLSALRREDFYLLLTLRPEIDIGVGIVDVEVIDSINILQATHQAMRAAVDDLTDPPESVIVDGFSVDGFSCPTKGIVGGDEKSLSIAAASVIAKVTRDSMMKDLDVLYPAYGFAKHKGYGTKAHVEALQEHGPSPVHRYSFRPVREASRK
jgi:ribonuclease HII